MVLDGKIELVEVSITEMLKLGGLGYGIFYLTRVYGVLVVLLLVKA